jgi:hypothetical protein
VGEAIHLTFGENYGHYRFHVRQLKTFDSHQVVPVCAAKKAPVKLATIPSKAMKIARATLFPAKPVVETSRLRQQTAREVVGDEGRPPGPVGRRNTAGS